MGGKGTDQKVMGSLHGQPSFGVAELTSRTLTSVAERVDQSAARLAVFVGLAAPTRALALSLTRLRNRASRALAFSPGKCDDRPIKLR